MSLVETAKRRLTREESRQQTRERLLDAARALFASRGIEGTSIEDITEQAGYSRGAFYSNFESKEALLLELLRANLERTRRDFEALFAHPVSPAERARLLRVYVENIMQDRAECMFYVEAEMFAIRHPQWRAPLAALLRDERALATEFVGQLLDELQLPGAPPASLIVGAFISLATGLRMRQVLEPDHFTDETVSAALMGYFDSVFRAATIQ